MKIIGVIPARYNSTRFPGKPLVDLLGHPMLWWVWMHTKAVKGFDEVIIATDDDRIMDVAESFGAHAMLTGECETATERLFEVSRRVAADFYVMVNGDEPAVPPEAIEMCIPKIIYPNDFTVTNLMTDCTDPAEVIDSTNLKVVTDIEGNAMFISRSPIPYPKGNSDFRYKKFVGVGGFSPQALAFYYKTPRGPIEKTEENDSFRFIENGVAVKYINAQCRGCSVDVPQDVDRVIKYLKNSIV